MKTIRNSSYVKNQYWKLSKRTNKQTKKIMWILAGFGDQGREKQYLEKNMRRERERERERERD